MDFQFSRSARRPAITAQNETLLQWASGLTTTDRRIYAGWFVEAGRDAWLDGAMQSAGFERVTIKHSSGNAVTHWAVEQADMFVAADGVQTIAEMKQTSERYGVAFGWRTLDNGKAQSFLKARVFLRELLLAGYTEPLTLSVRSTTTGDVIDALMTQYDVLDAIDALRTQQGKAPLEPPFYACSIRVGPGKEVQRGSGSTSTLTPPVAYLPPTLDREFLAQQYIRKEWIALIEQATEQAVRWSIAASEVRA